MKKIFLLMICTALMLGAVSCEKENTNPDVPESATGVYVLNNGSFNQNNSSLYLYEPSTKLIAKNVFASRNGKKLGDTGQDILIYGGKMYITVKGSGVLFVTDTQGNILKEIVLSDYKEPGNLTSYNGKVYVSYFDGGVAQIDTVKFDTKTVKVGDNPEELKAANGKIYVANSGGMNYPVYGKTVSVIDAATMKVIKTLEVADNPRFVEVDGQGDIYVISSGNYGVVKPVLQRISSQTDLVQNIPLSFPPVWFAMGAEDKLYIIGGESDSDFHVQGKVYTFNTSTEKVDGAFVTDGTEVKSFHYLSADGVSGDVYVGSSDYVNNGDMYVFGKDGKLKDKFETGLNPIKCVFLRTK